MGAEGEADNAEAALRHIYDLLYFDIGPEGEFYNPDKTLDDHTLKAIAGVVRECFR